MTIYRKIATSNVGTGLPDGPSGKMSSMGIFPASFAAKETKFSHRGKILFRTVREAGPYRVIWNV